MYFSSKLATGKVLAIALAIVMWGFGGTLLAKSPYTGCGHEPACEKPAPTYCPTCACATCDAHAIHEAEEARQKAMEKEAKAAAHAQHEADEAAARAAKEAEHAQHEAAEAWERNQKKLAHAQHEAAEAQEKLDRRLQEVHELTPCCGEPYR